MQFFGEALYVVGSEAILTIKWFDFQHNNKYLEYNFLLIYYIYWQRCEIYLTLYNTMMYDMTPYITAGMTLS